MLLVARSAGRGTPLRVVRAKRRGARAGVRVWVWVLAWVRVLERVRAVEGEREEREDGGREERPRLYSTPNFCIFRTRWVVSWVGRGEGGRGRTCSGEEGVVPGGEDGGEDDGVHEGCGGVCRA